MGAGMAPGLATLLTATDDAGNRCRVVWDAVGRSGDELVGKIKPASECTGHLEGVVHHGDRSHRSSGRR